MAGPRRGRRSFGSVRRLPSGRWQARYYDKAGHRHTAPETFPTKSDALAYLATVEADMNRGLWTSPALGRITLAAWSERWRQLAMPALRPTTRDLYTYLLARFLLPTLGEVPLANFDTLAVRTWLARLQADTTIGPSTRAKAYRLLSRILGEAVEAGYIHRNPCTVKGAGVERAPEMRHATVAQVHTLANTVTPRFRALILVAAYGGLRWGELVGLRQHRVNPLLRTVTVAEQVSEINGTFVTGRPKTDAGLRTVTLPAFAVQALVEHLDRYAERGPKGLVFPGTDGSFLRRSNFRRRHWLPATRKAGVEGLRFHDLRHTAATFARAAGASTKELMTRMGHTSPAVALRYEHVMRDRDEAIAAALDELAEGRKGTQGAREERGGEENEVG